MRIHAAKYLLLLTGFLMLGLTVMPHHHHGDEIHFAATGCADEACRHDCGHDPCTADHHHETDADCQITRLFLFSAHEEVPRTNGPCDHGDDHPATGFFAEIIFAFTADFTFSDTGNARLKYPPYVEPSGTTAGGHRFSLRAPPVFIA